ncbi:MAG TPA: biotin/lipoyl-containing protein [Bryobacteraceae bacterium]|nr:biotin/lipoyl-containing protein [Bryobacteraceae bacterium]
MKLTTTLDGRTLELELEREGDLWRANGRTASVLEVEPGIYSVLLDDRSYEARIEPRDDAWAVTIGRRRFLIAVADPRRRSRKPRPAGEGRQAVVSPMPGKVVRVLVASGDSVEAGQGLIVIEAMKMQNELKAPRAGRVSALTAREGATVAAGDALAVIE